MPRNRTISRMLAELYIVGFGDGDCLVYQLLDHAGTPIYIGQTNDLQRRLSQHAADKDWFSEVKSVWYERVPRKQDIWRDIVGPKGSIEGAYTVEKKRIKQFEPRYNQKAGRAPRFETPTATMAAAIPIEQRDRILAIAAVHDVGPADLIREAIAEWLDRYADDTTNQKLAS